MYDYVKHKKNTTPNIRAWCFLGEVAIAISIIKNLEIKNFYLKIKQLKAYILRILRYLKIKFCVLLDRSCLRCESQDDLELLGIARNLVSLREMYQQF